MPQYRPVSLELPTSTPLEETNRDTEIDDDDDATATADAARYDALSPHDDGSLQLPTNAKTIGSSASIARRLALMFWTMGVLNNVGYVIMIAAAKSISEGGVALIFLANIVPSLAIKASAPYWFEKVSYERRLLVAMACMVASFFVVASFSESLGWQLCGVAFGSAQAGLGEATLLALAGKIDGRLGMAAETETETEIMQTETEILQTETETQTTAGPPRASFLDGGEIDSDEGAFAVAAFAAEDITDRSRHKSRSKPKQKQKQKGVCLNSFSSGTGFAGVFGFFWKWFWNNLVGLSLSTTLWLAMVLAAVYFSAYRYIIYLQEQQQQQQQQQHQHQHAVATYAAEKPSVPEPLSPSLSPDQSYMDGMQHGGGGGVVGIDIARNQNSRTDLIEHTTGRSSSVYGTAGNDDNDDNDDNDYNDNDDNDYNDNDDNDVEDTLPEDAFRDEPTATTTAAAKFDTTAIAILTARQRFFLVLDLWPYMLPLFVVYVAEYTLQSGTWSTIGFPVTDVQSRDDFFEYSNWMYQVGVFVSRSSGTFFLAPMLLLWAMPVLQVINVGFYWFVASHQEQANNYNGNYNDNYNGDYNDNGNYNDNDNYNYNTGTPFLFSPFCLYPAALYTGLLGGAVYVHGYLRICRDLPLERREFALSATSLAESLGIVVADVLGLVVQACLYRINGLDGAVVSCPAQE
eukprot:CAMPEP_0172411158 /NCGR_PEP_ID=MMETSP1061-20121228/77252_1 /TAXON_ID=37318 /ORGANISM="Pseudo-nitzschia pungens, Strain cf. pungens" /LENGTH=687 /DNA_ID=CAMNT_0013147365 /DNA_START=423 /DNA_END=2486 /DNA_ORIENTATION=-